MTESIIEIIITEDNPYAQKALQEKLAIYTDIAIVHIANNGQETLDFLAANKSPQLVLMDVEMPVLNGIEATGIIKKQYPNIKIIMITIYDDDDYIFNAILMGADSYILKETKADKIYETIIDTLNGGAVMSPSIAVKTLQLLKNTPLPSIENQPCAIELSTRETEILELLAKGMTNKKIAEQLFISPFTVKRHIENTYQKLQAHNRIELLEKARKSGFI